MASPNIMTESTINEDEVFQEHHTALEEDEPVRSFSAAQASFNPAETITSAHPARSKLSVDDGLRAFKAALLAVEQSFD